MTKPTVADLARVSGLSAATVDRVLNGRSGVSVATREKVARAVQDLRYGELPRSLFTLVKPRLRLKFILPLVMTSFSDAILRAVQEAPVAVEDMRVTIDIQHVDIEHPDRVARALDEVDVATHPGVALFASDTAIVAAAIDRLVARGGKVVTMVTDTAQSGRHHFVGIDNTAAGRVAGNLMGRFLGARSGKVAVVLGSLAMRDQHDRYIGFSAVLQDKFPGLRLLPVSEGFSNAETNHTLVARLLRRHNDLVGIYSAAAGNRGVLKAMGKAQPAVRPVVLMHDLSSHLAQGLRDGVIDAVISQNPGHIARSAVRVLKALWSDTPIVREQEQIRIEIYLTDSLP